MLKTLLRVICFGLIVSCNANIDDQKEDSEPANLQYEATLVPLEDKPIYASPELGLVAVGYNGHEFRVFHEGVSHSVEKAFVDAILRDMTVEEYVNFLTVGYITVKRFKDGDFGIKASMRLKGGGPVTGMIAYWLTKGTIVSVAIGGAGAAMVATGGTVGAMGAAGLAVGTAGAGAGVTVLAAGVAVGGGATAAVGVAGAAATVGAIGQAVMVTESAAMGAAWFFGCIPFLP